MTFDIVDCVISHGTRPVSRVANKEPLHLDIAECTGVYKTHVSGDLKLMLVRNALDWKYALNWEYALVWIGGTENFVYDFDMSRCEPWPVWQQPGIRKVCEGRWMSKRAMNEKLRGVFDRCDSRGVYS